MNESQITVVFVLALLASVFALLVFSHARRAVWFEAVLWLGTLLVAPLGAILGIAAANQFPVLRESSSVLLLETPLVPTALGALGGALVVNVPLRLMGPPSVQEKAEAEIEID